MSTETAQDRGATPDGSVVRRSLDEPAAFGELFDRHAGAIHRYLARRSDTALAVVDQTSVRTSVVDRVPG